MALEAPAGEAAAVETSDQKRKLGDLGPDELGEAPNKKQEVSGPAPTDPAVEAGPNGPQSAGPQEDEIAADPVLLDGEIDGGSGVHAAETYTVAADGVGSDGMQSTVQEVQEIEIDAAAADAKVDPEQMFLDGETDDFDVMAIAATNENVEDSSLVPDKDQFNRADFPDKYSDAKFLVIKPYSEDDVHKSIKYSVWSSSTPNGNKKLDAAYQEAREKTSGCPIFLFFSVNTSGQFIGVAEMVGPVDFNKTVDYWYWPQDNWTGCFPVKWHIVKDVPNNIFKHIALENNDNKPVTHSRDTQEVKLEQGLQMLKLFKEHVSKTSILDDFDFYETRQKAMEEKRAKQQQLQKQVGSLPYQKIKLR